MADIYQLAKLLGAKNITESPFAASIQGRNYLSARGNTQSAEEQLQGTKTPLGAISSGIALYVQRKREQDALDELNKQMEAEQQANAQRREALIGTLPESERVIAGFLDDKGLQDYAVSKLKPMTPQEQLDLENQKLQNEKLRKELSNKGKPDQGKAPAGYRFNDTGDLEAIPGGPATKQSAESAGKIALIKQGLDDINAFEKQITDEDGTFNRSKIVGLRTYSRPGARDEYSKLVNSLNARLRLESGAAVPESEVARAFETFAPGPLDSDATIQSKIKRLKEFFSSAQEEIGQGRGANPIKPSNSSNQFTSSSGVKFTIKR